MSDGETIVAKDVPEHVKEDLDDYKDAKGLKWNGMMIKLHEVLDLGDTAE